ncbi:MAG: 3-hydroxyisobutyrate dehydrogenase [Actinomycetota bacterium]|jgi:3-hydroxyisobutyrate dehydrogenase-like beta-hydroxyacid dehydrogenase|nr:3-hydroxyisobutyrate dehydrogenase [Actinomycetota bacterium]
MNEKTPTVGFCGLGTMGLPMAANLARALGDLHVWNRNPARTAELDPGTRTVHATPGSLAHSADTIVLMLWDGTAVEDVLFGPDGIAPAARPGTLVIDMSTSSPALAQAVSARLGAQDIRYVDAPVTGARARAEDGTLVIMAGGSEVDVAEARDVTAPMAKDLRHVGPVGSGQLLKLANNVLGFLNVMAVTEALALVHAHGADLRQAVEVFQGGTGRSLALELYGPWLAEQRFDVGVAATVARKDLGEALATAAEAGCRLPGTAALEQSYAELLGGTEDNWVACHAIFGRMLSGEANGA